MRAVARLSPFAVPDERNTIDVGARTGRNFAAERADENANVFDAVSGHVRGAAGVGQAGCVALWSEGSRERMSHVLSDHGLEGLRPVADWPATLAGKASEVALAVLGLETGFETDDAAIVSEQDILGDRLVRPRRASKRADNFIAEATSLSTGDLVVHVDHGIGRFAGLTDDPGRRRAARLPRNPLCRRRQALPAGREHRASIALWLRGYGGRTRSPGRHRLADAKSATQEPHTRNSS